MLLPYTSTYVCHMYVQKYVGTLSFPPPFGAPTVEMPVSRPQFSPTKHDASTKRLFYARRTLIFTRPRSLGLAAVARLMHRDGPSIRARSPRQNLRPKVGALGEMCPAGRAAHVFRLVVFRSGRALEGLYICIRYMYLCLCVYVCVCL